MVLNMVIRLYLFAVKNIKHVITQHIQVNDMSIEIKGGNIVLHGAESEYIYALDISKLNISKYRDDVYVWNESTNMLKVEESFDDILEAKEKYKKQLTWFGHDWSKPLEDEVQYKS